MKRIPLLLLSLMLFAGKIKAQHNIYIHSQDSLYISIQADTIRDNTVSLSVGTMRSKNNRNSFNRFSKINNDFYDTLNRYIRLDSIKKQIRDSITLYWGSEGAINFLIAPTDTMVTGFLHKPDTIPGTKNELASKGNNNEKWGLPEFLTGASVLVLVIVVFYFFRNKIPWLSKKTLLPAAENERAEIRVSDILSKEQIKEFGSPPKEDYIPKEIADYIVAIINGYKGKNDTSQTEMASVKRENAEALLKLQSANDKIREHEQSIEELRQEISKNLLERGNGEIEINEIKKLSRMIIERHITLVTRKVREMNDLPERPDDEIRKYLLENLLTFAFHSESILKKLTKDNSEYDEMNISILQGSKKPSEGIIHENSMNDISYPLPVQVFKMLKFNGVSELKDVYIQGYKIGKQN